MCLIHVYEWGRHVTVRIVTSVAVIGGIVEYCLLFARWMIAFEYVE